MCADLWWRLKKLAFFFSRPDEINEPYPEQESRQHTATAYFSGLQTGVMEVIRKMQGEHTGACIPVYFYLLISFYVFYNSHRLIQPCMRSPYKEICLHWCARPYKFYHYRLWQKFRSNFSPLSVSFSYSLPAVPNPNRALESPAGLVEP